MLRAVLSPGSLYTLKRFGIRLAIVLASALVQIPSRFGFGKALELLLGFTGLICTGIAIYHKENPFGRTLSNWDEAVFFLILCVAAHFVAFHLWHRT